MQSEKTLERGQFLENLSQIIMGFWFRNSFHQVRTSKHSSYIYLFCNEITLSKTSQKMGMGGVGVQKDRGN